MPVDISRVRALCFDIDGTLSDTDDQYVGRLAGFLRRGRFLFRGQDPLPFARRAVMFSETPGTFFFGIPDRLKVDHHLSQVLDRLARRSPGAMVSHFVMIPGVREALEQLRGRYPMAVVTARGERSTQAFLSQTGLAAVFPYVASAQTCRYTKPYPDPILWAAKQMGVPASACLMVGDTTVDMRAGKAAGAQAVGVLCGFGEEAELRRAGAEEILSTTADLVHLLCLT